MIKKISIFLLFFGICLFGYILYVLYILKSSVGSELSSLAILTTLCGGLLLVAEDTKKQNEKWKIPKMLFFYFFAAISFALIFVKIGGEKLWEINYWPISLGLLVLLFSFLGWHYRSPSTT
ncbi:hypothetical protein KAI65_02075 [Candidatus Parcubacteria bacterium]|nr:hypothetical protein [Candidatus Parcubacteria bacterium]